MARTSTTPRRQKKAEVSRRQSEWKHKCTVGINKMLATTTTTGAGWCGPDVATNTPGIIQFISLVRNIQPEAIKPGLNLEVVKTQKLFDT